MGGEAAVAEGSSSEMEAVDLRLTGAMGISRVLLCLSCNYGVISTIPLTTVHKCMTQVSQHRLELIISSLGILHMGPRILPSRHVLLAPGM